MKVEEWFQLLYGGQKNKVHEAEAAFLEIFTLKHGLNYETLEPDEVDFSNFQWPTFNTMYGPTMIFDPIGKDDAPHIIATGSVIPQNAILRVVSYMKDNFKCNVQFSDKTSSFGFHMSETGVEAIPTSLLYRTMYQEWPDNVMWSEACSDVIEHLNAMPHDLRTDCERLFIKHFDVGYSGFAAPKGEYDEFLRLSGKYDHREQYKPLAKLRRGRLVAEDPVGSSAAIPEDVLDWYIHNLKTYFNP